MNKLFAHKKYLSIVLIMGLLFMLPKVIYGQTPSPTPTPTPLASCITLPVSDTFTPDGAVNSQLWNVWQGNTGFTIKQAGGMLQLSGASGAGYIGVITQNKVCGDFDVSVNFNQFTAGGQSEADARLSIEDQANNSTVFIERFNNGTTSGFHAIKVINGTETQFGNPITNISSTLGKMRIRRMGSTYTLYYDVGNGWQAFSPSNAFSTNAQIALIIKSWDQNPSVSANFTNFGLTQAIPGPSATVPPLTPTVTPLPTPPSGADQYTIDPGNKQSLAINIGAAINPLIRLKAKLGSVRSTPDLYFRLRVRDEAAAVNNPSQSVTDTCNNPPPSDHDYYIPAHATGGVYSSVSQNSSTVPTAPGASVAAVSADGWVTLDGVVPGKYYTLYLKGPMTRKSRMIQHILLQPGQGSVQDFDWSANTLDPGDLPDPNNNMQQDCVINATDWSLLESRIGSNDTSSLAVCDVNYDGICNAGDSVAILNTLSTRPDDDQ